MNFVGAFRCFFSFSEQILQYFQVFVGLIFKKYIGLVWPMLLQMTLSVVCTQPRQSGVYATSSHSHECAYVCVQWPDTLPPPLQFFIVSKYVKVSKVKNYIRAQRLYFTRPTIKDCLGGIVLLEPVSKEVTDEIRHCQSDFD